jgi:hypothetical protein
MGVSRAHDSRASHRDISNRTYSKESLPFVRVHQIVTSNGPYHRLARAATRPRRLGSGRPRSTSWSGALCRLLVIDPEPKCGIVGRNPSSARGRWCLWRRAFSARRSFLRRPLHRVSEEEEVPSGAQCPVAKAPTYSVWAGSRRVGVDPGAARAERLRNMNGC